MINLKPIGFYYYKIKSLIALYLFYKLYISRFLLISMDCMEKVNYKYNLNLDGTRWALPKVHEKAKKEKGKGLIYLINESLKEENQ